MFGIAMWFITAPADDQVCRDRKIPLFDHLHGITWQPTCQQLIDRIEARAAAAERSAADLQGRVEEIEQKLNM